MNTGKSIEGSEPRRYNYFKIIATLPVKFLKVSKYRIMNDTIHRKYRSIVCTFGKSIGSIAVVQCNFQKYRKYRGVSIQFKISEVSRYFGSIASPIQVSESVYFRCITVLVPAIAIPILFKSTSIEYRDTVSVPSSKILNV